VLLAAITLNINPILVQLGPLAIRWYGIMYVVGIIVGVQAGLPFVRSRGITDDQVWNVLGPCIVAGLIGGRLFYVVQQPLDQYIVQPWRIIATWEGGMAFYGAIFAVILTLIFMAWRSKLPFWWIFDGAAIFAAVGQFFGRIGNLVNGDILGPPTNLPWGVIYAHPNSFAPSHTIAYQPAPVYEMIANLILIGILFALRYRLNKAGMLAAVYLVGYSLSQFIVFFLRDSEPIVGLGFKQAQLTSIIVFVAAVALAAWRWRVAPVEPPVAPTIDAKPTEPATSADQPLQVTGES
jgi:phosphatidylglycerol:prolipoprotein diacylglycerol transferase